MKNLEFKFILKFNNLIYIKEYSSFWQNQKKNMKGKNKKLILY
jgi:hypothetical protein